MALVHGEINSSSCGNCGELGTARSPQPAAPVVSTRLQSSLPQNSGGRVFGAERDADKGVDKVVPLQEEHRAQMYLVSVIHA